MKKVLSLLLVACMLFSCLILTVAAAEEMIEDECVTYTFFPTEEEEEEYIVENTGIKRTDKTVGGALVPPFYYFDTTKYLILKYPVKLASYIKKVSWVAKMGGGAYYVDVSTNGTDWTHMADVTKDTANDGAYKTTEDVMIVSDVIEVKNAENIYIKLSDKTPENGYGPQIYSDEPCTLMIEYNPIPKSVIDADEVAADDRSISLNGCNGAFAGFTVDRDYKLAGSACWSAQLKKGGFNYGAPINVIDGTGYDTLEFDWYISDVAKFKALKFTNNSIELTSSGKQDDAEIAFHFDENASIDTFYQYNKGGELKDGWNHVVLNLKNAKPTSTTADFDISKINYMRIFMVGLAEDTDVVVKYDNIRLTKAYAEEVAAAKEEAAPTIEKIEALAKYLTGLTADNVKKAKAELASAQSKLAKLEGLVAEQVTAEQKKILTDVEAAIEAFEKAQEEAEKNPTGDKDKEEDKKPGEKTDPDASKGGCKSVVLTGAGVMAVAAIAAGAVVCKRKEN